MYKVNYVLQVSHRELTVERTDEIWTPQRVFPVCDVYDIGYLKVNLG